MEAGRTATFLPKPIADEAGSGMHVHMQLFRDGQPIFYDENGYGQLSDTALWFIGGLLKHAASLCAITNPSTNSYKRLVPGFEAPVTVGYAMANRSAVVRIPAYAKAPKNKRFELRNPDATCNPYYAFAAILMAGLDGIQNKIDPKANGWGPYDFNLFDLPEEEKAKIGGLPKSLEEALDGSLPAWLEEQLNGMGVSLDDAVDEAALLAEAANARRRKNILLVASIVFSACALLTLLFVAALRKGAGKRREKQVHY